MDPEARKRLRWIELFLKTKNQSLTCLKCGISRPTLRTWLQRYQHRGVEGLIGRSRRPISSPSTKISEPQRGWIRELRNRNLGSRRIQNELRRVRDFNVSRTTIDKVLKSIDVVRVIRPQLRRKGRIRYTKEIPGERVQ